MIEITILNYLKKPVCTTDPATILNTTGPAFLTRTILQHKDKIFKTDVFFPSHYFCPFPNFYLDQKQSPAEIKKRYYKTCTYGIHYWETSWFDDSFRAWLERKILRLMRKLGLKKIKM